ncbi:MAG: glutaminyl-peptide cyclotransferase, partial [Smithella sp.]
MHIKLKLLLALVIIFFSCTGFGPKLVAQQDSPLIPHSKTKKQIAQIKIINTFLHDSASYTEGLAYRNGYLYESTGQYGKSSLKKTKIKTAKTVKEVKLSHEYFGEGMTILDNKIYQLTWQNQTGFIYNLA